MFRPAKPLPFLTAICELKCLAAVFRFPRFLHRLATADSCIPRGKSLQLRPRVRRARLILLSTISGYKLEDVKAASSGPVWYQLYLVGGREVAEGAIERARNAGFSALVVTVDTAVAGMRERDPRNGMKQLLGGSIFSKIPHVPQILCPSSLACWVSARWWHT